MKHPEKPWREVKKWDLPILFSSHKEKYESGELYTLIRLGRDCEVGDLVSLFLDDDKPYDYNNRTKYFKITHVFNIILSPDRFSVPGSGDFHDYFGYFWKECDGLAKMMGIDPASGIELGRLLNERYDIPEEGIKSQIIGWKQDGE